MQLDEILEKTYFNNTVLNYLIAIGVILAGMLILQLFKRIILRKVKKWADGTDTSTDNFLIESLERFGLPALHFLIIYVGLNYLTLSPKTERILHAVITVVITFMVIRFLLLTIRAILRSYLKHRSDGEEALKQLSGLMLLISIVVWSVGILSIFNNLGYDITAIIAGLGIGGIAVALAAQNILGDLFNYFVIFLDKPFELGDFIIIDDKLGVVEHIGVKTTRIKALSGEQLVFSNSDLTNSRIHNYKRMQRRRILFRIGTTYQTSHQNLKEIPGVIKRIVQEQQQAEFDRAHFASYGDFSLDFEIVYYVLSSDFNVYMDIQQNINLRLYEEFERMGVEFAYLTQTLFLNKEGKDGSAKISR